MPMDGLSVNTNCSMKGFGRWGRVWEGLWEEQIGRHSLTAAVSPPGQAQPDGGLDLSRPICVQIPYAACDDPKKSFLCQVLKTIPNILPTMQAEINRKPKRPASGPICPGPGHIGPTYGAHWAKLEKMARTVIYAT
ncbi:Tyrosine-protein kinase FRK [Frankliniella fusca]|uniref:Tyrosine-protein kinase FRK n=1 Tax=Frankliniella fusca TaxID=407009 RepID=A0AAE1LVC9_9NEOP|nr:Tyrosine-protein kinase FRK [Frankliniella fusca]